jgi:hypothetical protein
MKVSGKTIRLTFLVAASAMVFKTLVTVPPALLRSGDNCAAAALTMVVIGLILLENACHGQDLDPAMTIK